MRARELLVEYQRGETISRFGAKLLAAIKADESGYAKAQLAGVKHALRFKFGNNNSNARDQAILEMVIKEIEDCISVAKFIPWAVNLYCKGDFLFEDFAKAGSFTDRYAALRQSGYFKRNPEANAKYGDINRFRSLSDLGSFLMDVNAADAMSNAEQDRQLVDKMITDGAAVIVHDDATWKVIIPNTEEAAIFFGRNTQWCTAAVRSNNMFKYYTEQGPLYIILNKPTNRRWQLHIPTGQFMDENDNSASFAAIAPLILAHVFDDALSAVDKKGPFHVLTSVGFPAQAIEPIVKKMGDGALTCLALAWWDAKRRQTRLAHAVNLDPNNFEIVGGQLVRHGHPMIESEDNIAGVKRKVFATPHDLFLYAFRNGNLISLFRNEFGNFDYMLLNHFEQAIDYLSDCCVLEVGQARVYFCLFDGLINTADTMGLGMYLDDYKKALKDDTMKESDAKLVRAVLALADQMQKTR